jgi:hypothetical protein
LKPVILSHWRLTEVEGLNDEAEAARDRLLRYISRLEKVAARLSGSLVTAG